MFNDENRPLPVLLCTSTLIEGVNTAAKSVLIYDKVINKADYDFFTFSNIRGRAGRLGEHLVGKVFLFHLPPESTDIEVTPPLFQDLEEAPDELVVHLEDEERSARVRERVDTLAETLGLSIHDLRRLSALGIETLADIKEAVENQVTKSPRRLVWRGHANYENLLSLTQIVCAVSSPSLFGAASAAQLELLIRRLRAFERFKAFFQDYAESNRGYEHRFEFIFKFLRACEYSLPEYFIAIEKFVKLALPNVADDVDYSLLVSELSRWFRPEPLKALEEQGVPIQISEMYFRDGDTVETLADRLRKTASTEGSRLTDLERDWVLSSLPVPERR